MRFFCSLVYFTCLLLFSCQQDTQTNNTQSGRASEPLPPAHAGMRDTMWVDSSRIDPQYGGFRSVDVQVWYPADDTTGQRAPYMPGFGFVSNALNLSARDEKIIAGAKTSAYDHAALRTGKTSLPILIYSPDLGGHSSAATYYAERFARQGYVVMGVNHLHESKYVRTPEGFAVSNQSFHDSLGSLQIPEEISVENFRLVQGRRIRLLAEDLVFALNKLMAMNSIWFEGRLDSDCIGTWGLVMGGATAIDFARVDERVCAVVNIDGTPSGLALSRGMQPPFMYIEEMTDLSQRGYEIQHQRRNIFCSAVESMAYRVIIAEAHHNSFSDYALRSASGQRNKQRAERILNIAARYMETFFDRYVSGQITAITPVESDSLRVMVFP